MDDVLAKDDEVRKELFAQIFQLIKLSMPNLKRSSKKNAMKRVFEVDGQFVVDTVEEVVEHLLATDDGVEVTIVPKTMTKEEFNNLPEY